MLGDYNHKHTNHIHHLMSLKVSWRGLQSTSQVRDSRAHEVNVWCIVQAVNDVGACSQAYELLLKGLLGFHGSAVPRTLHRILLSLRADSSKRINDEKCVQDV